MKFRKIARSFWMIAALAVAVLAIVGCAASAPREQMAMEPVYVEKMAEMESGSAPAPRPAANGEDDASGLASTIATAPRMIIQTASLELVVQDTTVTVEQIKDLVRSFGGYISNSNIWEQGDWLRANLTLRVPADDLDALLDSLKDMAVKVQRESLSGEDVTEQYSDLGARLRNLEATETELLSLLTEVREKPGSTAEDILDVHRRLTEIRGEIEQIKGRMQYLEQMTALATIEVQLIPDPLDQPVVEPGWAPLRTLTEASRTLVRGLKKLVDVLIWIVVVVLPILLLIAIPIAVLVLLIRWLVRRSRSRKAQQADAETES